MIGRDYRWYAVYVTRHHEKKALCRTVNMGVETILPMRMVTRRWSDRLKVVEEPLFPSYMFVRTSCREYFEILDHPSVVKYISFGGKPAVIPDNQIEDLKKVVANHPEAEVIRTEYLPGEKVIISKGPLTGTEGELLYGKGGKRFSIRIDSIGYSLLLNVPSENLLKVSNS